MTVGIAWSGCIGAEEAMNGGVSRGEKECRWLLDALQEVGLATIHRHHVPGEEIYRAGEDGGALYILTGGVARISAGYTGYTYGRGATLRLVGPWELFGYPALCGRTRMTSAEAVTGCEVAKAPRIFLERALEGRTAVRSALMILMELALVEQEEMLGCLLPRKTEARLARLLPILLAKFGEDGRDGGRSVGLRLTRTDLAAMVASTRESVTSAVIGLQERGIVTMRQGRLTVLDPEALAEVGAGRGSRTGWPVG